MFVILNNIINNIDKGILNHETRVLELDLSNCDLKHLPDLSNYINLKKLNISFNKLTCIDGIPNSLEELDCSSNYIYDLPKNLPPNLRKLNCFSNIISSLQLVLPDSLEWFNCSSNSIEIFNCKLPRKLVYLNCSDNNLVLLPELNTDLEYLDYSYNFLIKQPILPTSILTVYSKHSTYLESCKFI
jgi:Leucine-rich repeat (LRR) protein